MNNGDLIVCGVSEDTLVEDIGVMVPKGDAVPIQGHLANKSKDLWRLLSQSVIFRLNENSLLRVRPRVEPEAIPVQSLALQEERDQLSVEVQELRSKLSRIRSENQTLRTEVEQLREEKSGLTEELSTLRSSLVGHSEHASKLDALIELVKSRPVVLAGGSILSVVDEEESDDSIPLYIPSQIKSDSPADKKVSLKEGASDVSSVSDASKALKGMRRKAQSQ